MNSVILCDVNILYVSGRVEARKNRKVMKVPKGTSDYQAAWIVDDEEEENEDDEEDDLDSCDDDDEEEDNADEMMEEDAENESQVFKQT